MQCRIQTPAGMNRVFTVQNSNSCRDEQGVYSAEFKLLQGWTGCLQCRIQTPAGMNRVFTVQNSNSCRDEQGVYSAEFKLLQGWTGCLQCRIQTPAGMNRVFTMQNSDSCRDEQGVYNAEFKIQHVYNPEGIVWMQNSKYINNNDSDTVRYFDSRLLSYQKN